MRINVNEQEIDSHIQMPKLVLKHFVNPNKKLFYYDFTAKRIKRGTPASLNTEVGYYSKTVEHFMDVNIENKLGDLLGIVDSSDFPDGKALPWDYKEIVGSYVYALIARAPSLQAMMNKDKLFAQTLSAQDRHDIAAHDAWLLAQNAELLGEYEVSVLSNKTDEEWVLPTGGLISVGLKIFCPVSPTKAFKLQTRVSSKVEP